MFRGILYCVGHVVQRRTRIADVVTDGRIIPRVTTSGEELLDKKVVGSVFTNGLLNPLDVGTTITLALIRAEAENIGPVVVVVADIPRVG